MAFEDNNGTQYYQLSCGVPSDPAWDADNNNGSAYFYKDPNNYILWGTDDILQYTTILPDYLYYDGENIVYNGENLTVMAELTGFSNIPTTSNNFTYYYFLSCNIATDPNWNPEENNGTAFYYNSAFNCVSFCE